ncbi:MAG: hypothetical protein U0792_20945 [Gemmataceae bacterium]
MVRVACPLAVQEVVAAGHRAIPRSAFASMGTTVSPRVPPDDVIALGHKADVVAIGPGLGQEVGVADFVRTLVASTRSARGS